MALGLGLLAIGAALAAAGCRGGVRETFVTWFDGDHGLSLRHPAAWRTQEVRQETASYRYFLAPPLGPDQRAALSVMLIAAPLGDTPLETYAQGYRGGLEVLATRAEERQGVSGHSWSLGSKGEARARLLLVASEGRVAGLFAQGDAVMLARHEATLDEMFASFAIERPDRYPVRSWPAFGAALGIPGSWRQTREFGGGGTLLVQFASPPLAAEKGQTVHAALSLTLEPAPGGGTLNEYYEASRGKLGDNFVVTSHQAFKGGYVDVMRTETSLAISYIKRYYFTSAGRACSLSFEAREDVFPRAARWADYVASTLRLGPAAAAGSAQ